MRWNWEIVAANRIALSRTRKPQAAVVRLLEAIVRLFRRKIMVYAIAGQATFKPVWEPLEDAIPYDKCGYWMYMGGYPLMCGVTVHSYKHSMTRDYVSFSDDGRAWVFAGDDGYREIPRDMAIATALKSCAADEALRHGE